MIHLNMIINQPPISILMSPIHPEKTYSKPEAHVTHKDRGIHKKGALLKKPSKSNLVKTFGNPNHIQKIVSFAPPAPAPAPVPTSYPSQDITMVEFALPQAPVLTKVFVPIPIQCVLKQDPVQPVPTKPSTIISESSESESYEDSSSSSDESGSSESDEDLMLITEDSVSEELYMLKDDINSGSVLIEVDYRKVVILFELLRQVEYKYKKSIVLI
ncbi:uncharacterized protein EV154DRAFT_484730 [Mucor mucedo]|uniref:uncharacterized protein n=1 Tax=Mucor mucedo TaxID=29922 RepID=UPI002220AB96|nr:uncharacterized protein EV154DRAFT_484730 [Mucor mucedo]KAI7887826.1 hypothetical protein EV154DRAFT_484730 [Mucor mucedo]